MFRFLHRGEIVNRLYVYIAAMQSRRISFLRVRTPALLHKIHIHFTPYGFDRFETFTLVYTSLHNAATTFLLHTKYCIKITNSNDICTQLIYSFFSSFLIVSTNSFLYNSFAHMVKTNGKLKNVFFYYFIMKKK